MVGRCHRCDGEEYGDDELHDLRRGERWPVVDSMNVGRLTVDSVFTSRMLLFAVVCVDLLHPGTEEDHHPTYIANLRYEAFARQYDLAV